MSAFPDSLPSVPAARAKGLTSAQFAACATALAVLGLSVIWPAVAALWGLWTTDALKSFGMVIPLVSMVLIFLRVWKTLGWQQDGTWWGLLILLITLVVERVQERAVLIMVVSPHWSTPLPPPSLVLLAYGSGVVLLFGGVRLYRAALFPILLLWFANPIPHVFSLWVDLPLQRVSAHIARAFAMSLGQPLTPDNLRLMFTPSFGMFIAPGCNGIRGAMTMGFIALIAGYINRFRWFTERMVRSGRNFAGICVQPAAALSPGCVLRDRAAFPFVAEQGRGCGLLHRDGVVFLGNVASVCGDPSSPRDASAAGTDRAAVPRHA